MTHSTLEQIHNTWDRLAEYPEPQLGTEGLHFLLESICGLTGADHAFWLSAVLFGHLDAETDPLLGWRPGPVFFYQELPDSAEYYKKNVQKMRGSSFSMSESTTNHVRQAGSFRATLLRDHVSPDFYQSDFYREKYLARNITDALYVIAPVNADTEVYFCFNRVGRQQLFTHTELEIASETLRGLGWFHKKVLLGHGLTIARKPLTPTEKKVMHLLLTELTEQQIAERLGQRPDTTHKHIGSIYRKLNVNSRAALMAVWLGRRSGK